MEKVKMLFKITNTDKNCYENELRDFLPEKIIDIHTHVWLKEHKSEGSDSRRTTTWPDLVAKDNPIENLLETYKLMFPDKHITPMIFANYLSPEHNLDAQNEYINQSANKYNIPALLWSLPSWSKDELDDKLSAGKFLGVKSYLANVPEYIPASEIRIFDIFPHHQLELLNAKGMILMLHIPRPGRLKDPVNLAEMIELDKRYPNIKTIIAHVGRAYCPEDIGNAFEILKETQNIMFDISANTCSETFKALIESIGPKRILFGSDLPITRMRMKRICENGKYINLVPPGLYGDVFDDPHMREVSAEQSEELTLFLYEELLAFKKSAELTNLTHNDIEDIFYNNAKQIIESAKPKPPQLKMVLLPSKLSAEIKYSLPSGYAIRTYKPEDKDNYIALMNKAGFSGFDEKALYNSFKRFLPNGTFLIVHKSTNQIVATASASHNIYEPDPYAGLIDWVSADPEHRGKGLGYIVCAAAVNKLIKLGYKKITLSTDDYRLPAIKTYIKLGFSPIIDSEETKERWKNVYTKLGIEFKV